jgi:dihydroflavonol-4-reductase
MDINISAMKILLTGATGFLGQEVTRTLAESGHTLRILHRAVSDTSTIRPYAVDFIVGDITDPIVTVRAGAGMDAIVHMAANLSHWAHHKDRIYRTNVIGTRIVAEAAKTAGVPTLVHTSSIAAVGYSASGTPIGETSPNNFIPLRLLYHESKRLAEEEALDAAHYGVRVIIVNPGVLYGPRSMRHTFGHTMLELAAGKIPGHPTGGISLTDVADAAFGISAALERGRGGERYLLTGHNMTYEESFRAQAQAVGATYTGRAMPASLLHVAARVFEAQSRFTGKEPRLTIDNAKIAPLKMWYDASKARNDLGYSVRPLEITMQRMVTAYQRMGALP